MKEEPKTIDLDRSEWESDAKPYCYQRDPVYIITCLIIGYPVYWVVSNYITPTVAQIASLLFDLIAG